MTRKQTEGDNLYGGDSLPSKQAHFTAYSEANALNADIEDYNSANIANQSRKSSTNGAISSVDKEGGAAVHSQQASCVDVMKQKLRGSAHRYNQMMDTSSNDIIT